MTLRWDIAAAAPVGGNNGTTHEPTGGSGASSCVVPVPFLCIDDMSPDEGVATATTPSAIVRCSKHVLAIYISGMVYATHRDTIADWHVWVLPSDVSLSSTSGVVCIGARESAVGVCTTSGRVEIWCAQTEKAVCSTQAFEKISVPNESCVVLASESHDSSDQFLFVRYNPVSRVTDLFCYGVVGEPTTVRTNVPWHHQKVDNLVYIGGTEEYILFHELPRRASSTIQASRTAEDAAGWLWACHLATALTISWQLPEHYRDPYPRLRLDDALKANAHMMQIFSKVTLRSAKR